HQIGHSCGITCVTMAHTLVKEPDALLREACNSLFKCQICRPYSPTQVEDYRVRIIRIWRVILACPTEEIWQRHSVIVRPPRIEFDHLGSQHPHNLKCGLHRVSIPHAARMHRNHREAFVVTIRIFYAWNVDVAEDISCHYRSQKGDVWPAR